MNWGMTIIELQKPTHVGKAHGHELPCHDHRALPLLLFSFPCSFVLPNHLVWLCHIDRSISLVLTVTTAPLWTLGIAKCQFSYTDVVVPYGLVSSVVCECLPSQLFLVHRLFWFSSFTVMSGSEGSGLLRHSLGLCLLPWWVNRRVVGLPTVPLLSLA